MPRIYYVLIKLFYKLTIVNSKLKDITPFKIVKKVNEATPFYIGAIAAKIFSKSGDVIIIVKEEA